ncbi:radical S-adenosyl methionine domain-containing 1, mitochondrial [Olea europaea subsp. europaea]|uniref:Radical S-adenosyl methionine domain-containing 1, mitochondrial n=1 Tax=Olea europaea subsp. europaea TaxID=158383 RepID=A0A8S0SMN2_OLEEU|nr:radical S-adenosyl methionine domain-containing 1, mitochondrial [Olea europaea subsp. europaea]
MYAEANPSSLLVVHKLPPTSAYIHLPFCRKRRHYYDFPIIALGSSSSSSFPSSTRTANNDCEDPRILNYVETLCREMKATNLSSDSNPPLETVFFGGGTPSLVPPKLVTLVLDTLMSLGVQAFQEELMKACGGAHGVKEIHEAVDIVKSCGLENWSVDLISSLPHQTPDMWEESLELAIQIQPTHVSVYDLQVEQGTKFGALFTPGEFPLPSENQSAEFYKMASRMLRDAGYDLSLPMNYACDLSCTSPT